MMIGIRRSITAALHDNITNNYRYATIVSSLVVASTATAAINCKEDDSESEVKLNRLHDHDNDDALPSLPHRLYHHTVFTKPYSTASATNPLSSQLCKCEENIQSTAKNIQQTSSSTTTAPQPLSRLTLLLYSSYLYPYSYLKTPRLLTPNDPIFTYQELKRGLAHRQKDEDEVKQILSSSKVREARANNDQVQMNSILKEMNTVVYGKGITPQMREDFLIQYGCTGYTDEILEYLVDKFSSRGIIEVGAGNGQWARALSDHYKQTQKQQSPNSTTKAFEFVKAYDNMNDLPLSPKIYHKQTLPANKYFYDKVQRLTHIDSVQKYAKGRALLLVYPPPGSMALETVDAYVNASPGYRGSQQNDTVIYVGEGKGGANANDAFFDYLLGCNEATSENEDGIKKSGWVLEKVMNVQKSPGGKGYEKMFIFKRSEAAR